MKISKSVRERCETVCRGAKVRLWDCVLKATLNVRVYEQSGVLPVVDRNIGCWPNGMIFSRDI